MAPPKNIMLTPQQAAQHDEEMQKKQLESILHYGGGNPLIGLLHGFLLSKYVNVLGEVKDQEAHSTIPTYGRNVVALSAYLFGGIIAFFSNYFNMSAMNSGEKLLERIESRNADPHGVGGREAQREYQRNAKELEKQFNEKLEKAGEKYGKVYEALFKDQEGMIKNCMNIFNANYHTMTQKEMEAVFKSGFDDANKFYEDMGEDYAKYIQKVVSGHDIVSGPDGKPMPVAKHAYGIKPGTVADVDYQRFLRDEVPSEFLEAFGVYLTQLPENMITMIFDKVDGAAKDYVVNELQTAGKTFGTKKGLSGKPEVTCSTIDYNAVIDPSVSSGTLKIQQYPGDINFKELQKAAGSPGTFYLGRLST